MKATLYRLLLPILLLTLLAGCDGLPAVGAQGGATATPVVPLVTGGEGVIAEGSVVPRDSARLYTRTGGKVAEVLAAEGDVVEAGAVLLRFGERETAEAALTAAQLEETQARQALDDLNQKAALTAAQTYTELTVAQKALIDAQQALADLDTDAYQTDLDNARKDVSNFKEDLEDAQTEFDKFVDLDADNADRKRSEDLLEDAQEKYDTAVRERDLLINQMDAAEAVVDAAKAVQDDLQTTYDERKSGPDPDDLDLAEARLRSAEAQVKAAEKSLADLELKAPFAATLVDFDVTPGETLLPNQPVATIADFGAWFIETSDLTEIEVVRVSEGSPALITPDALPALELPATVESIAREAGSKGGDVTYTVRLKLEASDPRLRWGMTVEVNFADD